MTDFSRQTRFMFQSRSFTTIPLLDCPSLFPGISIARSCVRSAWVWQQWNRQYLAVHRNARRSPPLQTIVCQLIAGPAAARNGDSGKHEPNGSSGLSRHLVEALDLSDSTSSGNGSSTAASNRSYGRAPSSSASVSSTEGYDQLTPLPTSSRADRPALLQAHTSLPRFLPSPPLPSLSELMVSPSLPDENDGSQSYFPSMIPDTVGSPKDISTGQLDPASAPLTPSDCGLPPKAASDSGTFSTGGRPRRNPRVRNTDAALAPHGSFTSRARSSTISSRSSAGSSRSVTTSPSEYRVPEMDPVEREKLFKAASRGDQLAMHRLGWRPQSADRRHHLGSTQDIWGSSLSPSLGTRRSSQSSQSPSHASPNSSPIQGSTPPTANKHSRRASSDLISDVVQLTLRSNARANTSARANNRKLNEHPPDRASSPGRGAT
ncbi:hypothetical protein IAU60_004577 [Kwoniella sp. DSM 27419]